ncbi:MAG: hypothetical protein K8U57_08785 [Planctomycetes bacterium]|nr:hypothetical protein [Planctomycetota bacterium]
MTDKGRQQPRFNLGTDKKEAEFRYQRVQALYDDCCRNNGEAGWTDVAFNWAAQLAAGKRTVEFPRACWGGGAPPSLDERLGRTPTVERDYCLDYAQIIEALQRQYPSVVIVPADPDHYTRSHVKNQSLIAKEIRQLEVHLRAASIPVGNAPLPAQLIPGSLHETLDAYAESIRRDGAKLRSGKLVPYQRKRIEQVERLKELHADIPLHTLNFDKCKEINAFWRNRPKTKKGTPSSASDVKNQWMRFLRWLDTTDSYQWTMPSGVESLSCRAVKLEGDRRESIIMKVTYTPDQLAVLNHHARPLERLCLYLGLNCGMGAAELGRLQLGDFAFNKTHPHATKLAFQSTDADSFLTQFRPKTEVFGQWILWPEVVEFARWAIKRAEQLNAKLLFVWDNGSPMYDEESQNPQIRFANLWNRLLDRVQKSQPDFLRLPFGSLRDTLPDVLRQRYTDDLASLCLAHGSPSKADTLLECYANKPFGRLHTAIRELRAYFAPVFATVVDPLDETKHYLSFALKDKIRALLTEKKAATEIARECEVSTMTVYRERTAMQKSAERTESENPISATDELKG